jgi:glycosyltransferase involved in cell wall biosynthesis
LDRWAGRRATNPYVKRIRPEPSSLITISDFLVDEFYRNHGIRPQHIIPMGIDVSMFGARPAKDIDVIGVGSLSRLKQYDLFVEIVGKLRENFPGIKTMLCGDGEEREHIEEMIQRLSLRENVILTGCVPHNEALSLLGRSKILMHPSSYEGFGMVCMEALYAGAHVVSFVKPMHHHIQSWHIVKNAVEMQAKVLELLSSEHMRHEPILLYSIDDTAKKVMQLFHYPGSN